MKTYTKLDTKEAFNKAMDAGKTIQYWNVDEWMTKYPRSDYYENTEYRTVEETELPEQGDEILVWDSHEQSAVTRKFIGFVDCWESWKSIDKKPIEGWIHPDALSPVRDCSGLIKVREVLEDE